MKIKYYGTGAAEGIPALFCNCDVCRNALKVRGKEIKTRSQALVDDKILIDFPADTYMHVLYGGLDLKNIRTLIITHDHSDHIYERDFWCRLEGVANNIVEKPLDVYLTRAAYKRCAEYLNTDMKDTKRVVLHEITPFVPFEAEGYKIIPLAAKHAEKTDPVIFIIEKGGKSLLYAHDTGTFPEKTSEFLSKYGGRFDFVSLDCTGTLKEYNGGGHMTLGADKETFDMLVGYGVCDKNTIVYVNHFSHNGGSTHDQLSVAAAKYGFAVAYDGLEVEF